MTDPQTTDIVARLNEACIGHPSASIPWPHHLLHDAVAEIERLRALAVPLAKMFDTATEIAGDGGDWEGGDIQSDAVTLGFYVERHMTEAEADEHGFNMPGAWFDITPMGRSALHLARQETP